VSGRLGDGLAVGPVVGVVATVTNHLGPDEFGVLAMGELVREGGDPLSGGVRRGEHDPVPVTLVAAVQARRELAGLDGDALLGAPAVEVVSERPGGVLRGGLAELRERFAVGLGDVLSRECAGLGASARTVSTAQEQAAVAVTVDRQPEGLSPYVVVGDDEEDVAEVNAFLAHLAGRGRASYTLRSYALGLADFVMWLQAQGIDLDAVDLRAVEAYVTAYRLGPKGGAATVDPSRSRQLHPVTRKPFPSPERQPRTVNHRLSVLSSLFTFLIDRDNDAGSGAWQGRYNPVPSGGGGAAHGSPGRDAPRRGRRGELRQRTPRQLPRAVDPALAQRLIDEARSWRDKALLTLLWRTGQRIGDWHEVHGCHGLLGLRLYDVDERSSTLLVRLKGARDEHRVPVTEDFWPLWHRYLVEERCWADTPAAWVGFRRGRGKPLTYAAFESALRTLCSRLDVNVNAHMFRHALAEAVVATSGLKVTQELLGHRHIGTTADTYVHVDQQAMIDAVGRARTWTDLAAQPPEADEEKAGGFVFAYDPETISELDAIAGGGPVVDLQGG
jgi:integrase/recombinase XerD